ncbi:MAG TPA: hypothetical protein VMT76_04890 [Puia sp.]|nr:hypothetical protein [Puia sp.]
MLLSRNQFFVVLFMVVTVPFLMTRIIWLVNSRKTTGAMAFISHSDWGSALGMSTYAVIDFKAGKDSLSFNSYINLDLTKGQAVSVLYQKDNPSDAIVDDFYNIWARAISYAIFPVLIVIVLYVIPDRMDPLIPSKSKILLGKKPFIKIIPGKI